MVKLVGNRVPTYVNRLLAFVFASDASFDMMMAWSLSGQGELSVFFGAGCQELTNGSHTAAIIQGHHMRVVVLAFFSGTAQSSMQNSSHMQRRQRR